MKFSVAAISAALLAVASAAPVVEERQYQGPDPSKVFVKSIVTGGSGCPAGSVSNIISSDRTTFTLIFDDYEASTGQFVPVTESRKNCQLNIALNYPSGFQYSIFSSTYRGYAGLAAGQTGVQKSTYYFSGQSQQVSTESDFTGPYSSDYTFTDNIDQVSVVWSPCQGANGMLNINSQVRITGNMNANGLLTTDSIDGKFTQILALQWRKC